MLTILSIVCSRLLARDWVVSRWDSRVFFRIEDRRLMKTMVVIWIRNLFFTYFILIYLYIYFWRALNRCGFFNCNIIYYCVIKSVAETYPRWLRIGGRLTYFVSKGELTLFTLYRCFYCKKSFPNWIFFFI